MKTAVKYGAVLIGIYLGVYYYTGAGTLLLDGSKGVGSAISALQGRSGSGSNNAAYPSA